MDTVGTAVWTSSRLDIEPSDPVDMQSLHGRSIEPLQRSPRLN
jgi:hypothetical protein